MFTVDGLEEYFASESSCAYRKHESEIPTFQREETMSNQVADLETDDEDYWHCPHPPLADRDHCLFHTDVEDEPDDFDVSEAIVLLVTKDHERADRSARRRSKQFIGATFEAIDLNFERVDTPDNLILDFRCCEGETMSLESTEFENPVDIRGSDVDEIRATKSTWDQLYAQELTADLVEFDQASLQRAYFENTTIERARFYWTDIDYVNYHECDVRWGNFMYAQFGEAGFFDAEFHVATFCNATIEGGYFNDASFAYLYYAGVDGRSSHFSGASAEVADFGGVDLDKLTLKGGAAFDWTVLDGATIGRVKAVDSAFGITSIENAEIDTLLLRRLAFFATVSLDGTTIGERVEVAPADGDRDVGYVSFVDAEVAGGEVSQPDESTVVYDFTNAVVGDVDFHAGPDESPLNSVRFYRTDFAGFKFSKLAEVNFDDLRYTVHTLGAGTDEKRRVAAATTDAARELHPTFGEADPLGASGKWNEVNFEFVADDGIERHTRDRALEIARDRTDADDAEPPTDVEGLETTYLRAKNGASDVGDSLTAGRFFERERRYRRRRHWNDAAAADSWRTKFHRVTQWIRNVLFAATAGYGERPMRVVASAVGVIVLFTGAYALSNEPLAGVADPTLLEYLLFSLQSFIAFVVGSPSATDSLTIRMMSAFEGFVGAFFVGLFVFVLTRQVHR